MPITKASIYISAQRRNIVYIVFITMQTMQLTQTAQYAKREIVLSPHKEKIHLTLVLSYYDIHSASKACQMHRIVYA